MAINRLVGIMAVAAGALVVPAAQGLGYAPAAAAASAAVPCGDVHALKLAIAAANKAGSGVINLAPSCTYTLVSADNGTNGLPAIKSNLTLNGHGSTLTRHSSGQFRILEVDAGRVTINALTLRGGSAPSGGGILTFADLTLNGVVVSGNRAHNDGGGISSGGLLVLNGSRVSGNTAAFGGGLIQGLNRATLKNSQVTQNTGILGGGINVGGHTALGVTNSQISANTAATSGGGITSAGAVSVTGSQMMHNTAHTAGGGVFNDDTGTMRVSSSQVDDNTVNSVVTSPLVLHGGGGIFNNGPTINLHGVQMEGNRVIARSGVPAQGGAIGTNAGTVTLDTSMVIDNEAIGPGAQGGGIFRAAGTVTLIGSLVVGNVPGNCFPPGTVAGCSG